MNIETEILVIAFESERISISQTSGAHTSRPFGVRFESDAVERPQRDNGTAHSRYATLDEVLMQFSVELVYGDRVWTHPDYRNEIEKVRCFELLYNGPVVDQNRNTFVDVEFTWDDCPPVGSPCN